MEKILKWGALILVGWLILRYLGGLFANVSGSLQSGQDTTPVYPGNPYGFVYFGPGLVGAPAQWRNPYRGRPRYGH